MSSSRTVSYEFTAKQSLTAAFTETRQSVAGAAGDMDKFSQRISATASESDKLKVSVRETGNEFTRMKDQAQAAAAQNKTAFEQQRNDLRLLAEQARTTAAQTRAAQAAAGGNQGGGGLLSGLPQISLGNFIGNQASQAFNNITSGITNAAGASLTLAGNLEQSQVAFTGLLGNAAKATDMIGQLRDLDLQAGIFNFQDLQKYSTALLGVGDSAQRVIPDLKDLGSEIAGRGQGPQQLEQATLAYEQVIAKGKLAGQEALQFQNAQIPIWQILADALHKNVGEIQKMSEAGQITSQIVQDAFHLDAVTKFGTALADQTHTFNGLIDTGKDLGQIFLATFGEGVIKDLEPRLQGAMDALQNPAVLESIRAWGVEAGKFVGQLFDAAKVVASWAGLQLPDIPAAPDFAPAKEDTAALQAHLQQSLATSTDFTRQITSAKTEVQRLRDAQAESSAKATQSANDIRDAQTATDRDFDRRLNTLKDEGTQMERNYQIAKQQRDLEQARTQLADDTRLAGDIFSSAGQAARERLKEDRKRVTDQQEQMAQDTAKFENRQAQTSVERAKQASDQRAQDSITALERSRQAEEQATQARIRDLDATARNYEALQKALASPDKAIKQATTEYSTFYQATIPQQAQTGTQSVISTMTQQYTTFYQSTLPKAADTARPLIFTALFGSGEEQQQAGADLANNMITGLTQAFMNSHDHNLKIIGDLLKGDLKAAWDDANADSPEATLPAWLGGGGIAGTGVQPKLRPNQPPPGRSPNGHYEMIGDKWVWVEDTPSAGVAPAALAPEDLASLAAGGVPGRRMAGPVSAATSQYGGYYGGGRAGGGMVEGGGWYRVGESGPEWLHAGGVGRVQANAPGGDTYIFNISGVIGNQTQVIDAINQALAQNIRRKGAR